jgi:hypothetical protein
MIGSVIRLLFFPYLKRGEKEGKRGWKRLFFITFSILLIQKLVKKEVLEVPLSPFPPSLS